MNRQKMLESLKRYFKETVGIDPLPVHLQYWQGLDEYSLTRVYKSWQELYSSSVFMSPELPQVPQVPQSILLEVVNAIVELLGCTELNMDDMEDHTRHAIKKAHKAFKNASKYIP